MRIFMAAAIAALLLDASGASAREFGDITRPYTEKYGDWKKTRKALRKMHKKNQPMSGDDWFVLAAMCNIEPPEGPSMIMNFANRSPCKDDVVEYFVKAGMEGTPEGFYEAAKMIGSGDAAWLYAELAYRLAGNDTAFEDKAFSLLEDIWLDPASETRMKVQAAGMVTQLTSDGPYGGRASSTQTAPQGNEPQGNDGYRSPPPIARGGVGDLRWLDFTNPRRCQWSRQAADVISGTMRFDERGERPIGQRVRVPGVSQPVMGRVSRPDRDGITWKSVDFRGQWNGLTVLGLTDGFFERSHGVDATGIRFAEPVETVARKLSAQGFVVNADGSERRQIDKRGQYGDFDGVLTRIERKDGETIFFCNEIFWASYGEGT